MLKQAQEKWKFNKAKSLLIGDKKTDILCADKFGIRGYLFNENNLFDFVTKISLP